MTREGESDEGSGPEGDRVPDDPNDEGQVPEPVVPRLDPVPVAALRVFWSDSAMPMAEEIRRRFDDSVRIQDGGELEGALWSLILEGLPLPGPVEVRVMPRMDELPAIGSEGVRWRDRLEQQRAERTTWFLAIEAPLDASAPLASWQELLRVALRLCDDTPAIFDLSSCRLRAGSEVERLTSSQVAPRSSELYSVHAVEPADETQGVWLHTHGLVRAWCPELELLDLPRDLLDAGRRLIDGLAELLLFAELPRPGTPIRAGRDLEVAWLPWQIVTRDRDPKALGGAESREGAANDHGGLRAVILSADSTDLAFEPPTAALEAMKSNSGGLFMSTRETERMAALARERWAVFGMLFARHKDEREEEWRFLAKLGFEVVEGKDRREHLWFEVKELAPNRLRAMLLNTPHDIPTMTVGDVGWHELERLTDWTILSPLGSFDPETADYLWDAGKPKSGSTERPSFDDSSAP